MHNIVKCWQFKENFLDNFDPDEVIYIDNFDMTDVYLYSTYKDFEIIEVKWNRGSEAGQYFIDNTLRRPQWI